MSRSFRLFADALILPENTEWYNETQSVHLRIV